ncbi:LytR C-terminal domain-containing protein [Patescibacteria group bacterium]
MEDYEDSQESAKQDSSDNPNRTRVGFPQAKKEKKKGGRGTLIFIALAIIALVLVGVWLFLGRGGTEEIIEQEITPTEFEEAAPPTPTPTEVEKGEVSIQILNGSGISGAAGELQEVMEDLDYSDIEVGNASSQDYETTQVAFSSELPESVVDEITDKLDEIYEDVDTDTGTDEYDVEIITGYPKDYSPSPTEEPEATSTPTPTSSVTKTLTPTLTSSVTETPTPTP